MRRECIPMLFLIEFQEPQSFFYSGDLHFLFWRGGGGAPQINQVLGLRARVNKSKLHHATIARLNHTPRGVTRKASQDQHDEAWAFLLDGGMRSFSGFDSGSCFTAEFCLCNRNLNAAS